MDDPYGIAQRAIADLKTAVQMLLRTDGQWGLTNAQIGRRLGIYAGHVGHEGHISRTILAMLENEGVVIQEHESKAWRVRTSEEGEPRLAGGRGGD